MDNCVLPPHSSIRIHSSCNMSGFLKFCVCFVTCTLTLAFKAEVPLRPKYIIVSSRQRSSSTTLTTVISSHPCVISGNEIWTHSSNQDILGVHDAVGMDQDDIQKNPEEFLREAHNVACGEADIPEICGGQCTIAIKLFDVHALDYNGMVSLMKNPEFFFIVLERGIRGEFCSFEKAWRKNDWGVTPAGHRESTKDLECRSTTPEFENAHNHWFSLLRENLMENKRFFVDVPFYLVASCELVHLIESIFGATGLVLPVELDLQSDMEVLFEDCSMSG